MKDDDGRTPLASRALRVGDLARQTGKTVRALHLYEERGLLVPAERSKGGYRLYDAESLTRVRWIGKLQEMGFSLSEMQVIVKRWEQSRSAPDAMGRVHEMLRDKLAETREHMTRLKALEVELESSLAYLETCPSCAPDQILEACNSCELHEPGELAPELVAGFHAH